MSVYADYSAEEQDLLRASLEAAAVFVSAASPGRSEETASEGFAAASFVLGSGPAYVRDTLVTSVIMELQARLRAGHAFPDYVEVATRPDAGAWAADTLRRTVGLLDARASADEALGYRRWLYSIAQTTAEAGKEDQGFLGRGGVMINDAERAALAELTGLLGLPAPDARQG
jgi:hypothetical protein